MDFPTLYAKPSSGDKVKVWKLNVIDQGTKAIIKREHGYDGFKQTTSEKVITAGKNIGKKNETTYLQQAIQEAESLFKKQREAGYSETKQATAAIALPMLALDYNKRGKSITSRFALQPKLDGIRLLCRHDGLMYSRTGKPIDTVTHIQKEIATLFAHIPYEHIDGEFYSHDLPFEEISGIFRKKKLSEEDIKKMATVQYYIFDAFSNNDAFETRYKQLRDAFKKGNYKTIVLVETQFYEKEDKGGIVKRQHDEYVQNGYEGLMIRNSDSGYSVGFRSKDLQKYKEFQDEEYTIVGGDEATGNDAGTVIFICENKQGQQFHVRPRGSRQLRKHWLDCLSSYVGKQLTVRFQEYSELGIPRFPVGIEIRNYE